MVQIFHVFKLWYIFSHSMVLYSFIREGSRGLMVQESDLRDPKVWMVWFSILAGKDWGALE